VDEFMSTRPLEWQGNPKLPRADLIVPVIKQGSETAAAEGSGEMTKSQMKKLAKLEQAAQKKAEKAAAKAGGNTEAEQQGP
jgi:tryptophanyl-tRNA synthetase